MLARGLVAAGRAVKAGRDSGTSWHGGKRVCCLHPQAVWLLDPSAEHLTPDLPTPPVAEASSLTTVLIWVPPRAEEALRDFLAMMLRLVSQGTAAWGAARQVLQDAAMSCNRGQLTAFDTAASGC